MTDYIDTREGWREVEYGEWKDAAEGLRLDRRGQDFRYWVRESPVPPLPTVLVGLDGADLIFLSEVVRALGVWKQAQP